jgi:methane/ammonia monooxygenase subunit A
MKAAEARPAVEAPPPPMGPAGVDAARVFRTIDWMLLPLLFMVVQAAFHIHAMLTVGDWDFWTDWKDRRWWLVVTPISLITFPAAVQYVLWERFRLPIGATAAVSGLLLGQWVSRITNFYGWTYFPLNFTWPATLIPGALLLDCVLMLTRSYLLTGIIGGMLWGVVFYYGNWPMLAPFHLPVNYDGVLRSPTSRASSTSAPARRSTSASSSAAR